MANSEILLFYIRYSTYILWRYVWVVLYRKQNQNCINIYLFVMLVIATEGKQKKNWSFLLLYNEILSSKILLLKLPSVLNSDKNRILNANILTIRFQRIPAPFLTSEDRIWGYYQIIQRVISSSFVSITLIILMVGV